MKIILFLIILVLISVPIVAEVQIASSSVPSQQYIQKTNMTKSLGTGLYEFRSYVEGATVYIDDIEVGTISGGILQVSVPVFDHHIKRSLMMTAEGYDSYNETLFQGPKVGETLVIRGKLLRTPKNLTGTISIAVSPTGAEIIIDGISKGTVGESGILTLRTQKAGYHLIKASKKGFEDSSQRINVDANLIKNVRFNLNPITTGTIQISSTPSGAEVRLNGAASGLTPVTLSNQSQGSYTLDLILSGYQPYQTKVQVVAGETLPISTQLVPLPTPTPKPTPVPTTRTPTPTPTPTPESGFPVWVLIIGLSLVFLQYRRK